MNLKIKSSPAAPPLASFEDLYNQVRPHEEALKFYTRGAYLPARAALAPPVPARTSEPG